MSAAAKGTIAAIIPARNCEDLLAACVAHILTQTRSVDEIVLSVGPSEDATEAVARRLAADNEHVRIVLNANGDRGSGLNVALDELTADLIAMVDAQSLIDADYMATAERVAAQRDAAVVGGPMRPLGRSAIGRAMAAALRSPFGIGDSQFHFAGAAREVASVYLGVYRSSAFELVGRYNPSLLRTEDDDMNARIREAGLRIWLDPTIRSHYLCRNSLGAIWRQYHGYGYWKVALATVRPGAIRLRHVVPAAFVVGLVVTAVASILLWWPAVPIVLLAYFTVAWVAALLAPADVPFAQLLFPLVTLTMHVAYGSGTLRGLLAWPRLRALTRGAAP